MLHSQPVRKSEVRIAPCIGAQYSCAMIGMPIVGVASGPVPAIGAAGSVHRSGICGLALVGDVEVSRDRVTLASQPIGTGCLTGSLQDCRV